MNSTLLNELYSLLPESGVGHFILEHLEFVQPILKSVKPQIIWEFGFNTGHSAAMWLSLTDAQVYTVDSSKEKVTLLGFEQLNEKFPNRLHFLNVLSADPSVEEAMIKNPADLLLVDGDHSYNGCYNDLTLASKLKIKHIIIDNLEDTDNVKKACDQFLYDNKEYKLVKDITLRTIITGYLVRE